MRAMYTGGSAVKQRHIYLLCTLLLFFVHQIFPHFSCAIEIQNMQFRDQPITDILFSIAQTAELSIIPDATVRGNASYYFHQVDSIEAIDAFLSCHNLYRKERNRIHYISRISIQKFDDLLSIRCQNVEYSAVRRAISQEIGTSILQDGSRNTSYPITLYAERIPIERALHILCNTIPGQSLRIQNDFFQIVQQDEIRENQRDSLVQIETCEGLFSLSIHGSDQNSVIQDVMDKANTEYLYLGNKNKTVEQLELHEYNFQEILDLLAIQFNFEYCIENGVYILFDIPANRPNTHLLEHKIIYLHHICAEQILQLLPAELQNTGSTIIDEQGQRIILSGRTTEIDSLSSFIDAIDQEDQVNEYTRIELQNISAEKFLQMLPEEFTIFQARRVPESNAVLIHASDPGKMHFLNFLQTVDVPSQIFRTELKYINYEELLQKIPPSIPADAISVGGNQNEFYFSGSKSQYEYLCDQLEYLDTPAVQIRYQILVVQSQKSNNEGLSADISGSSGDLSTGIHPPIVSSSLDKIFELKFNVINHLGLQFASRLNAELKSSQSRIFADSLVHSISGKAVRFQNTNTFRYRDNEIQQDDNAYYTSGVTREITSGLILDITGWSSGAGMVTMDISATISKQGTDMLSDNPPPTSERIIHSNVRTPAGQAVILGGLIQQDSNIQYNGLPILQKIPLLGPLLSNRHNNIEESETAIYIVPFIDDGQNQSINDCQLVKTLYEIISEGD